MLPSQATTTLLALPLAAVAVATAATTARVSERDDCQEVHLFVARGFDEEYPGRQSVLIDAICGDLDSCDYEDIIWTTSMEYGFCDAVANGTANGLDQITAYNEQCPDAALVLTGYSQGAHVVGDMLGGGNGTFFEGCVQKSNVGLDRNVAPGNKIKAALFFGDDRHTANQSYNVESGSALQGYFPRNEAELETLAVYSDVLRSYCNEGDPICASGDIAEHHWSYFETYTDDAAEWVKKMIVSENSNSTATTSSSSSSSASTATSTASTSSASSTEASTTSAGSATSASGSSAASATSTSTNGAGPIMCSLGFVSLAFVAALAF